ncbi:MAG: hypothetical protein ACFCU6_00815 [Balneolaceae bacterium]
MTDSSVKRREALVSDHPADFSNSENIIFHKTFLKMLRNSGCFVMHGLTRHPYMDFGTNRSPAGIWHSRGSGRNERHDMATPATESADSTGTAHALRTGNQITGTG